MRHILILLIVFAGAAVSYTVGFKTGVGVFILLGVLWELAFWVFAFRGPR